MPKDNTHLFLSYKVLSRMDDNWDLRKILVYNISSYYLGSIIPDTFFYGFKETISRISDNLHGKEGNLTNSIIFELLDKANDDKNLAFTMGYITHCALDITFHPAIYYLSGNYYDKDPSRRELSTYLHRHLETCLEIKLHVPPCIHILIKPSALDRLIFPDIIEQKFHLSKRMIKRLVKTQVFSNRLFISQSAFDVFLLLHRLGIVKDMAYLGLFYGNIRREKTTLLDHLSYRDLITGEEKQSSIEDLFETAISKASSMMNSAYSYHNGFITKAECEKIISGESLGTGKQGVPVKDIRYTI